MLSHGYGGSWRNLNWLAGELVGQGYVVAAPDHPGTTSFNLDADDAAKLWERPRDLSRVIDVVILDETLAGQIAKDRIAAIGHSLGGWTVVSLAGARFDTKLFLEECNGASATARECNLASKLGVKADGDRQTSLEADLGDPRIKAIVSLDLGLARGFTSESLAGINRPALIMAAGVNIGDLPAELESGYIAKNMAHGNVTFTVIPDAMHFSFMQSCKPGAVALIEAHDPGGGIVCKDSSGRNREAIHRQIADAIIAFLANAIPSR